MSDVFEKLYSECERLRREKGEFILAIDGRAAAGKSTLATEISRRFGAATVHADDFFLPYEMRSAERLSQPGGNIHYERFETEVVRHLGSEFDYGVFDCSCGELTWRQHIPSGVPVTVEGAYCMSPRFGKYYDLSVFLTASADCRLSRIERRAPARLEMFRTRWMPLEEAYFAAFDTERTADIVIDTTDL